MLYCTAVKAVKKGIMQAARLADIVGLWMV